MHLAGILSNMSGVFENERGYSLKGTQQFVSLSIGTYLEFEIENNEELKIEN